MMPKFRVSLLSLTLLLAVPFAPQALAKTPTAVTASQPEIASGSAMIVDLATKKIIYASQPDLVRPMASITKVMTAMVVLDAHLPLDEMLTVDISHTPEMKGIYSRVRLNSQISRRDMLLLAADVFREPRGRQPGASLSGRLRRFYSRDERQAQALGMTHTRYVEPTGLSVHTSPPPAI